KRRRDRWNYGSTSSLGASRLPRNLVRDDEEFLEDAAAEIGRQGDIGGVAAAGHDDTADAGNVVPGVESVPASAQKNFVPAAEIHRQDERNANVAHVPGDVTRWNVQTAAEGDGEMAEVTANAARVIVNVKGGLGGVGELI